MFRLYVLNSAFAVLRLVLLVTMVHEVSLAMGTLLLAQFLMVRRYAALFGSVLQAGVSQYFIRFVPPVAVDTWLWLTTVRRGFVFWLCHVALLLPLVLFAAGWLSINLFGTQAADARTPYFAFMALSVALSLDYLARSLALAMKEVVWANLAELLGGSVLLIVIVPAFPDDLLRIFVMQSLVIGVLSLLLLAALWYRHFNRGGQAPRADSHATVQARGEGVAAADRLRLSSRSDSALYAWTRNAGALSELLLTTLGVWMLRHDLAAAAAFALLITLMKVVQLAATPISQIMAVSHAHRLDGNRDANAMLAALLRVLALALPFAYGCSEPLLLLWLGDPQLVADIARALPLAMVGVLGYAISQVVKGAADVVVRLPFNLYSNVAAIALHILVSTVLLRMGVAGMLAVTAGVAAAFSLLGVVSWLFARRRLKVQFTRRDVATLLLFTGLSWGAGYLTNALYIRELLPLMALVALLYAALAAMILGRQVFRLRELTA